MNYTLDGTYMTDREAAHEHIAEALDFPEYYGANLDALWDCLTDMDGAEITLTNTAAMLNALKGYGCTLLSTFCEAEETGSIVFRAE